MIAFDDPQRTALDRATAPHADERSRLRAALDHVDAIGLPSLIRQLLDNTEALDVVARRSFPHSNGFDRITLMDWPDVVRIRLHIWWEDTGGGAQRIHNHAWNFWSHVIRGALTTTFYHVSDHAASGQQMYHLGPPPAGASYGYTYSAGPRVRVEERALLRLPAETIYYMNHQLLHRVLPETLKEGPCVTLIAHGPLVHNTSDVVVPEGERMAESREPETFTAERLAPRLERLLSAL